MPIRSVENLASEWIYVRRNNDGSDDYWSTSGRYDFDAWETSGSATGSNAVGALVPTGVLVLVAVGVATAQLAGMVLESIFTAPLRAKARPYTLAPVFRVMLVSARYCLGT